MDNGFLAGISSVDLVIAGVFLLFIIIGVARGFTNDILSLLTWVGAFFATSMAFPHLQPMIRVYITEPFFADIVLGFVVFVVSLIILVWIAKGISSLVRKSMLSGLDRTFGILSGFFRGAILVTGLYFAALMFWKPGATPLAFQQAKLLPFVNTSAQIVHKFLIPNEFFPKRLLNHMYGTQKITQEEPSTEELVKSLSSPKAGPKREQTPIKQKETPLEKGYKNLERQALENLIDTISPKEK